MINNIEFPRIRNFIVHTQVYSFIVLVGLEVIGMLGYSFPFENVAIGIITVGHVHPSSMALVFLFGLYVIRPPFYQVNDKVQLLTRLVVSILIVAMATSLIEGSWDIVYLIKYYFDPRTNLITGVFGGIELMAEITTLCFALRIYKYFHVKRILASIWILYMYYFVWLTVFGFSTSGSPDLNPSFTIALIEVFHWVLGFLLFSWSLNRNKITGVNENA